jgi:hypothetical protein
MSSEDYFFEEQTEAESTGPQAVAIRIKSLVNLETEIYLTNLKSATGGIFRVLWRNVRAEEGFHHVGLKLLEPDGDFKATDLPLACKVEEAEPIVCLVCQSCHQKMLLPLPEIPSKYVSDGFQLVLHCDTCQSLTPWAFVTDQEKTRTSFSQLSSKAEPNGAESEIREAAKRKPAGPLVEMRGKGRAPLNLAMKVVRSGLGISSDSICRTENISRTGIYFRTEQSFEIGEEVQVIVPFMEGAVAIPVPARVVRQDAPRGGFGHYGVAVRLEIPSRQNDAA